MFTTIAPLLVHPLVLIGYALFLFFGLAKVLIGYDKFPKLSKKDGGIILIKIINYGFWLILVLIILAFIYIYYVEWNKDQQLKAANEIAEKYINTKIDSEKEDINTYKEQINILSKTISELIKYKKERLPQDLLKKAINNLEKGDPKIAEEIFFEIYENKLSEGNIANNIAAEAAKNIGNLSYYSNTEKAIKYYREAIRLNPNDLESLYQLAGLQRRKGNWDKATKIYKKIINTDVTKSNLHHIYNAYVSLSFLSLNRGEYQLSDDLMCDAVTLIQEIFKEEKFDCLSIKSRDATTKEEDLHKELDSALNQGDDDKIFVSYSNLAEFYIDKEDTEKAKKYYKKAEQLADGVKDKISIANFYDDLGDYYYQYKYPLYAKKYYRKSLRIRKKLNHKSGIARSYLRFGIVSECCGLFDGSENLYKRALSIFQSIGHKFGELQSYIYICKIITKSTAKKKKLMK